MPFRPIRYDSGRVTRLPAANSVAFLKGAAVEDNGSGLLRLATNASTEVRYICLETVTTTVSGQLIDVLETQGVLFDADTDAVPAQTDVGTLADLATNSTINPDASANDVFYIESIIDTATTRVKGYFVNNIS